MKYSHFIYTCTIDAGLHCGERRASKLVILGESKRRSQLPLTLVSHTSIQHLSFSQNISLLRRHRPRVRCSKPTKAPPHINRVIHFAHPWKSNIFPWSIMHCVVLIHNNPHRQYKCTISIAFVSVYFAMSALDLYFHVTRSPLKPNSLSKLPIFPHLNPSQKCLLPDVNSLTHLPLLTITHLYPHCRFFSAAPKSHVGVLHRNILAP